MPQARPAYPGTLRAFSSMIGACLCACAAFAAHAASADSCQHDDKECVSRAIRNSPVTKLHFWKSAFAKPVEQRIGVAPPELVEYLALDNLKNGFPDQPHPATVCAEFQHDVEAAIRELPAALADMMRRKLAGIYFVADIGGTGFTEKIYAEGSTPVGGFIVLDPDVLRAQTANSWATWKENTPFRPMPQFELAAQIESPWQDNRKNAIQYILLHELGHVLALNEHLHAPWGVPAKDVGSIDAFAFSRLSWAKSADGNRFVTLFDDVLPPRRDIVYYFGARLAADQMTRTYDALEKTNFATLYSLNNPADDFAEAFASYVHTMLMHKPFRIDIYVEGRLAKTYFSCWTEQRCAAKMRLLAQFVDGGR